MPLLPAVSPNREGIRLWRNRVEVALRQYSGSTSSIHAPTTEKAGELLLRIIPYLRHDRTMERPSDPDCRFHFASLAQLVHPVLRGYRMYGVSVSIYDL